MNEETSLENNIDKLVEEKETVSNDTNNQYTSTSNNTSTEASSIDEIPDINEVIPSSGIFTYPLLEEFLGDSNTRPSILNEVEFVEGQYGESVGLKLKDTWYRSSSKAILDETKRLQETNNLPCRVYVTKKRGKTGRIYHTLRGEGQNE